LTVWFCFRLLVGGEFQMPGSSWSNKDICQIFYNRSKFLFGSMTIAKKYTKFESQNHNFVLVEKRVKHLNCPFELSSFLFTLLHIIWIPVNLIQSLSIGSLYYSYHFQKFITRKLKHGSIYFNFWVPIWIKSHNSGLRHLKLVTRLEFKFF